MTGDVLARLPDGTVKQIGPLTGTRVWTVPGRANRPLSADRPAARMLAPGEHDRLCAFCAGRYLETTPEKARLVGPDYTRMDHVPARALGDTVAEFRRFGNLLEIVSAEYWRENYGFRQPAAVVDWADAYLADPAGRAHIERLAAIRAAATGHTPSVEVAALDLVGGSHDVIVARRHVRDNARCDDELVSSGVLTPDEHAAYMAFTVDSLGEIAGVGYRYPSFEVFSTAHANLPGDHSADEVRAVSDLVHALHASTGVHVPTNEEWHYRPADAPWPMPWRIVLRWRISNPAGFEGGTKIYVNTIDPWELRRRTVEVLHRLRDEGTIAAGIRIGDECEASDARLGYAH